MKSPGVRRLSIYLLLAIACCLAFIIGSRIRQTVANPDASYLRLLQEARTAVSTYYVEKPDPQRLVKGMIDGMLASLDPHSAYLPPEPAKHMEEAISGAFGGIGIEVGMKDGHLTAIAPIDDTPASRAGVQPNDHIWKVDGVPTRGMTIPAAVKRMRGQKGTRVTLTILREGVSKPLIFPLVRDIIKVKSIKSRMAAPGIGLIRIAQFQERTGADFKQMLARLHTEAGGSLKGLILDLRYNPGGLLGAAVDVANCFIGDDAGSTLIVSTKGRNPSAKELHATLGQKEPRYPIVVLINGGSASASEIVAGALQDHKRAVVMGSQSFGKGSVQSIIPLPGQAALKLTVARYYTPSGRSIQAKGITPDIEVGAKAPAVQGAVEGKQKPTQDGDNGKTPPEPAARPAQGDPHGLGVDADDYQVKRAVELLQTLVQVRERVLVR